MDNDSAASSALSATPLRLAVVCILSGDVHAPGPLTIGMQLRQLRSTSHRLLLHQPDPPPDHRPDHRPDHQLAH